MKNRLPVWFRQNIPDERALKMIRVISKFNLHTVCQEAKCPNLSYCFQNQKLTFMILGDVCTRNCRFCAAKKTEGTLLNVPLPVDLDEPYRIAEIVRELGINYVVITSVTRDDLADGGAKEFAKTIEIIHDINSNIKVEVLIPDFKGNLLSLKCILDAKPDVIAHNIETVKRLSKDLRPKADYQLSLDILRKIKELKPFLITKSSIMLGLGEIEVEVINTMQDLIDSQCNVLTLGQYLAPSVEHYPVKEFISIEKFQRYREIALTLGFRSVLSGPKIRSSYDAEDLYNNLKKRQAPFKKAPDPFYYV